MKAHSFVILIVVGCFTSLASIDVSTAQLFPRLRRAQAQFNNGFGIQAARQQLGQQPGFNSGAFRYTQPQTPVANIPSNVVNQNPRQGVRYQQYRLSDGRIVSVPVATPPANNVNPNQRQVTGQVANANARQQPAQREQTARRAAAQQQVAQQGGAPRYRVVTYYDPNTGRTFQRQYLITPEANQTSANQAAQNQIARIAGTSATKVNPDIAPQANNNGVVQSSFNESDVELLPLDESDSPAVVNRATSIVATSKPAAASVQPLSGKVVEYSVWDTSTATKVQTDIQPEPEFDIKTQTTNSSDVEYDFPSLNAVGEKGNQK